MRTFILICLLVVLAVPCYAGVYVMYEKDSGVVVDVSKWDDAVIQTGQEKKYIDTDVKLVQAPEFYDFKGGTVTFNAVRYNKYQIQAEKESAEIKELAEERALVEKKALEMAYDELVTNGHSFKKLTKDNLKEVK